MTPSRRRRPPYRVSTGDLPGRGPTERGGRPGEAAAHSALSTRACGLTYQAGLLEAAGLVTRTPSPDDERGVTLTITEAGRALIGQVLPGHTEVISHQLFQPLSRKETRALADLLAPVRDHMRSLPPRSAGPRRRR